MGLFNTTWGMLKALFDRAGKKEYAKIKVRPDPRPYLAGAVPGSFSSNHLEESKQFKGWQYVAIHSLGRMCSQAELSVHHVATRGRAFRKVRSAYKLCKSLGDKQGARYWREIGYELQEQIKADPTSTATKEDRRPVALTHPIRKLLVRPNPEWSLATLLYMCAIQAGLTGSILLWAVRNALGVPVELYVLPTGLVTPQAPSNQFPEGAYYLAPAAQFGTLPASGSLWSPGLLGSTLMTGCVIDARDVKAIRWPHPIFMGDGMSSQEAGKLWIDTANEIDSACWYSMHNSEDPGMLFEIALGTQAHPDDITEFREEMATSHAGAANFRKHLVLPEGVTSKEKTRSPVDMDFDNGQSRYRDSGLALHSMSPIACGITEAGSFGAYQAAIKQTTELAVQPFLSLVAGEISEFLGDSYPGPKTEVGFSARSVDDPQVLEQRLRTDVQAANVIKVDEYRALRGLPPLGGEEGNAFAGAKLAPTMDQQDQQDTQDKDPDKPDNQTDKRTGNKQPQRKRPQGRQDGNGKAHPAVGSNGRM